MIGGFQGNQKTAVEARRRCQAWQAARAIDGLFS